MVGERQTVPAKTVLAEVMGYYGRQMTQIESVGWTRIITDFGDEPVVAFLMKHMERSEFAPKLSEVLQTLRPGQDDAIAAFEEVARQVKACGPYRSPTFGDPAVPGAIVLLGGWVAVNLQLPDPSNRFEWDGFFKRFEAMYRQACANLMLIQAAQPKLAGLHDLTSRPALLAAPPAPAANVSAASLREAHR
jgi:hypothetical protein